VKKNNKRTLISLFVILLLTFTIRSSFGSDNGTVSLSNNNIVFDLKENDSANQNIKLNNLSNDDIYFSTYKISKTETPSRFLTNDNDEELGSYWLTAKQNYYRTSNNDIESSKPPYIFKWKYESAKIFHSPVLRGRNLYIPCEDGNIYLIDSRTGVFKERFSFNGPIFSLNMSGKFLMVLTKNEMNVFDRTSKILLWSYPTNNNDQFSCAAIDSSIYLASGDNLISFDGLTGSIKWKKSGTYITISTWKEMLLTTSSNNVISLFNSNNGDSIFEYKLKGDIVGAPTIYNDLIYATYTISNENSYSKTTCYDFKGNIHWNYDFIDVITASQSISDDYLLIGTSKGTVYSMNRYSGSILWKYSVGSPIHVSPSIASEIVYIGCNDGNIYGLDISTGKEIWKNNVKFPFYSEIILAQGFFYTTDNKGALVAWGREWENVIPPMSPEGLKGYPGNGYVTLFWRVSTFEHDLEGYNIYRKGPYESEFSFLKKLGKINNFQDTFVNNDTSYDYIIRAFDSFGNESASSSQVNATPSKKCEPVWLSYSPTQGIIKKNNSVELNLVIDSKNITPGLYTASLFIVHSGDLSQTEPIEVLISANIRKRDVVKPATPKIINFESSDTRVVIYWDRIDNVKSYKIYRSKVSKDEYTIVAELAPEITNYVDDTVKNGTKYYYSIKSIDSTDFESDYSDEIYVTPLPLQISTDLKDNSTVNDAIFDISGRADPKAKVMIRDKYINLDSRGNFNITVGVPVGESTIILKSYDTSNSVQTLQIRINYITSALKVDLKIDSQNVYVNGKLWPYTIDAAPVINENRTFVPLRFLSEIIGAKVDWFQGEKKIVYTRNNVIVELWINRKIVRINGKDEKIDASPFILKGRTMVPLRFITEPLGAIVDWDPVNQAITLNFKF
jgi:hypothetical protein